MPGNTVGTRQIGDKEVFKIDLADEVITELSGVLCPIDSEIQIEDNCQLIRCKTLKIKAGGKVKIKAGGRACIL